MTEITQFLQQNIVYISAGLLFLLLFRSHILAKIYRIQSIHSQDAFQLFQKKSSTTVFLDIRSQWELERGPKIRKSVFIPFSDLSTRMDEIKKLSSEKKLIIVCNSGGGRAKSAGVKLKKAGLSDVYIMNGGIHSWKNANYPVIKTKRKIKANPG